MAGPTSATTGRPSSVDAAEALAELARMMNGSSSSSTPLDPVDLQQTLYNLLTSLAASQPPVQPSHTMTLLSTVPGLLPGLSIAPILPTSVSTDFSVQDTRPSSTYHPLPTRSGRVPSHQETGEANRGVTLFNEYLSYDWPSDDEDDPDFTLKSDVAPEGDAGGGREPRRYQPWETRVDSNGESDYSVEENASHVATYGRQNGTRGTVDTSHDALVASLQAHPNRPTPVASTSFLPPQSDRKFPRKRRAPALTSQSSSTATSSRKRLCAIPGIASLSTSLEVPPQDALPAKNIVVDPTPAVDPRLAKQRERNRGTAKISRERAKKKAEEERRRLEFLEKEHIQLLKRTRKLEWVVEELNQGGEEDESEELEETSDESSSEESEDDFDNWEATSPAEMVTTPRLEAPLEDCRLEDLSRLFQWVSKGGKP
ncbi:hypothetical protein P7C70_g2911, partial [Phenoliferia sp. Uapishka_3]